MSRARNLARVPGPNGAGHVPFDATHPQVGGSAAAKLRRSIDVEDYPNLQAAITAASDMGGATVRYSADVIVPANTTITVPRFVSIRSNGRWVDPGNPSFGGRGPDNYAALRDLPKVIVPSTSKFVLLGSNQITGNCFARQGLSLDGTDLAANYAGTLFEFGATDSIDISDNAFLGFQQVIRAQQTARWDACRNLIDCNNFIWQTTSYDKNTVRDNHFYNVLQAGVTGNDPRTQRDGYAFRYDGQSNGGPLLSGNFAYGARYSYWLETGGHYACSDNWADGPTNAGTGLPLWADSVGVAVLSTGGSVNAEVNLTGFKVCAHAENIKIGAGIYGASFIIGHHNWGGFNAITIAGQNITIIGAAVRDYYGTGILFQNKAAADTCKMLGVSFYGRKPGAVEMDCGGGDPMEIVTTVADSPPIIINRVPISVTKSAGGLVIAPEGRDRFSVVATGPLPAGGIGDIAPRTPGKTITVTFPGAGFSLTGGNFKLLSAFAATADSSITLRCNAAGTQWVEQSRTVF